MSSLGTAVGRRRRHWKIATFSPFVIGIVGMVLGIALGYELAGSAVYLAGIVGGTVACGVASRYADVTLYDERFDDVATRASHYTYLTAVYLGLATFPALFVLEAAGEFSFGPVLTGVLYSFSALGLTWGAYYTVLDRRT